MLFGVITFVVVVSGGDPNDGSTAAVERAARAALGEQAVVSTRSGTDAPRPDAGTLVATVTWADDRQSVKLRTSDGQRTSEREIRFEASDAPTERGRTVGFALASMVPDDVLAPPPRPPAPPAPLPVEARPLPAETPPRGRRPTAWHLSFELLGEGAVGIGGSAGGGGGDVAGRVALGHGFAARVGFAARIGTIASAQATSRVLAPSIGAAWQTPLSDAFGLGVRIDALALNQLVSHFSSDDPQPSDRQRWLPGADARLEATFRVSDSTSVVFAFGPEIAFGTTRIVIANVETDSVPPVRLCGDVGVTVAF